MYQLSDVPSDNDGKMHFLNWSYFKFRISFQEAVKDKDGYILRAPVGLSYSTFSSLALEKGIFGKRGFHL